MGRTAKRDPLKNCAFCKSVMNRKRIGKRLEDLSCFVNRVYCGRLCMAKAMSIHESAVVDGQFPVIDHAAEKLCSGCMNVKPLSEFAKESRSNTGVRAKCRLCESIRSHEAWKRLPSDHPRKRKRCRDVSHRAKLIIAGIAYRSRMKKLPFDLDMHIEEFTARLSRLTCEMSGIPLSLDGGMTFDSPSVDRKIPSDGYVFKNIRIVCHAMNCALNNWGEDNLRKVMTAWLSGERNDSPVEFLKTFDPK